MNEQINFPVPRREFGIEQGFGSVVDAHEFIVPGIRDDVKVAELKECCQRLSDACSMEITLVNAGPEPIVFVPKTAIV